MNINYIIARLSNLRKQAYLKLAYRKKYAFVGIGGHSLNNLYPVLLYLRVPIKYIVTRSERNAETLSANWPGVNATTHLSLVLTDESIGGIFISTKSDNHFDLVKQALSSGKNVFVEKPPCLNLQQLHNLIEIQVANKTNCLVGLQRRYARAYKILKRKLKRVTNYNYKFLLGGYPEGNSLLEVFIHPIDAIVFLFGPGDLISAQFTRENRTAFIQIRHARGIIGSLELSTEYSWNNPLEELTINASNEIFRMKDLSEVSVERKPGKLLGVPLEKVTNVALNQTFLFRSTDIVPTLANNPIFTSGYYSEIESFIKLCELRSSKNHSTLSDLIPTYQLLEQLEKQKNV